MSGADEAPRVEGVLGCLFVATANGPYMVLLKADKAAAFAERLADSGKERAPSTGTGVATALGTRFSGRSTAPCDFLEICGYFYAGLSVNGSGIATIDGRQY